VRRIPALCVVAMISVFGASRTGATNPSADPGSIVTSYRSLPELTPTANSGGDIDQVAVGPDGDVYVFEHAWTYDPATDTGTQSSLIVRFKADGSRAVVAGTQADATAYDGPVLRPAEGASATSILLPYLAGADPQTRFRLAVGPAGDVFFLAPYQSDYDPDLTVRDRIWKIGCSVVHGIDISYPAKAITASNWNTIKSQIGDDGVVVVGGWGGRSRNAFANLQLNGARSAGLKTAGYCLLNFDRPQDGKCQVREALAAFGGEAKQLGFLAIDVEDKYLPSGLRSGNSADQKDALTRIGQALDETLLQGLRPVIYTRQAHWMLITGDSLEHSDVPVWDVKENIPTNDDLSYPSFTGAINYGDWSERSGKQYKIDTKKQHVRLPGLSTIPVDLDVFCSGLFRSSNPLFTSDPFLYLTSVTPKPAGARVSVSMVLRNDGNLDATNARITAVTLAGVATTTKLPIRLSKIPVCTQWKPRAFLFPRNVGPSMTTVKFQFTVEHDGKADQFESDVTLP